MDENDETIESAETSSAGEQLRAAREAKGLSLEEVASQTRIPLRHLESLEAGDWSRLPAPTYTIGFAKSYASAVGLDRNEIGDVLRAEMGGQRLDPASAEVFQPADPARTMPKWLVFAAIGGIVFLVLLMTWINNRSLEPESAPVPEAAATEGAPPSVQAPPQQQAQAAGAVVLTAMAPAWIQVTDQGQTLFSGELQPGQTYAVPQTASAPLLKAGKPEALRVTVGSQVAPPLGPPGRVASNVSLLPADLMRGGSQTPVPPTPTSTPKPAPPAPKRKATSIRPAPKPTVTPTPAPPAPSAPPGVQNVTQDVPG